MNVVKISMYEIIRGYGYETTGYLLVQIVNLIWTICHIPFWRTALNTLVYFMLRIPKKQQVPAISWQLGAFAAPRCCGKKSKSNKSCSFHMILGYFTHIRRIRPVIVSLNSSKATSPRDFKATWGFCRSETLWQKEQKQQVLLFSY